MEHMGSSRYTQSSGVKFGYHRYGSLGEQHFETSKATRGNGECENTRTKSLGLRPKNLPKLGKTCETLHLGTRTR